jgi:hypothetical protein
MTFMMSAPDSPFIAQAAGYHSAEDARRMQQLVQAMLSDRRHIALTSPDAETLARYSRLLVRDLRQTPDVRVLAHVPNSSEVMLDKFNELLADLPLDLGVDRRAPVQRPVQVFVVHDTPSLKPEELSLLVRLVNDLPGANLRLVLVQDRDLAVTASLQALGPQVLHWNILPPGMTAAQAARAESSREALRQALQDAMRESPQRQAADAAAARTGDPRGTRAPAPSAAAPARAHTAPARAKTTTKAPTKPAVRATAKTPPSLRAPTRSTAPPPRARRNGVILATGLALSAVLATTLGVWISMHAPATKTVAAASPTPIPSTTR